MKTVPIVPMKTIAIQVVPVIETQEIESSGEGAGFVQQIVGDVTPQFAGPNEATTGWSVYERKEDGTVEWFADTGTEPHAMMIGSTLAFVRFVDIELQPWRAA